LNKGYNKQRFGGGLTLRIFISWSGERSKAIAIALKTWLKDVVQQFEPWMSDLDIAAGTRWGDDIVTELQASHCGILCLTPENMQQPWLLFEAGALSKSLSISRVVPYLFDVVAKDLRPPLSQFQSVPSTREGTLRLLESLNTSIDGTPLLDPLRVGRAFEKFWPDLEDKLNSVTKILQTRRRKRNIDDYLEEILSILRHEQRAELPAKLSKVLGFAKSQSHLLTPETIYVQEQNTLSDIWVVSWNLKNDLYNADVRESVRRNLKRGIAYKYFIPNTELATQRCAQLKRIFDDTLSTITFVTITAEMIFPFDEIVLYDPTIITNVSGFAQMRYDPESHVFLRIPDRQVVGLANTLQRLADTS